MCLGVSKLGEKSIPNIIISLKLSVYEAKYPQVEPN